MSELNLKNKEVKKVRKDGKKITGHAVSRLIKQYGFKGAEGEAKKLLNICIKIARKKGQMNSQFIIYHRDIAENSDITLTTLSKWNVPDRSLVLVISNGKMVTVKDHLDLPAKKEKSLDEAIKELQLFRSTRKKKILASSGNLKKGGIYGFYKRKLGNICFCRSYRSVWTISLF